MVPNNRIRRYWPNSSKLDPPADYPGRGNKNPEGICFHVLLNEQLTAAPRTRPSLWSRIWRFFWEG